MLGFVRVQPSWGLGQDEFRVDLSERYVDVFRECVERDTVEDNLGPADFSINPIDGHVVTNSLQEAQEV